VSADERARRVRQLAIAAGLALVLVAVAIIVSQGGSDSGGGGDTDPANDTEAVASLFEGVPQAGNALGEEDAPVTLAEYADLQCPFCRDYAVDVLPDVVVDYVRSGEVRLELWPVAILGPDSERAAELAGAAALQDRLWELSEIFYRNQGTENSGYVTEAFLAEVAEATPGLDAAAALEATDEPGARALLARAQRQFERDFDSTPSFALGETGGRLEPVDVTLEPAAFAKLLDQALVQAGG
jgi:protein-disulfide isomerase